MIFSAQQLQEKCLEQNMLLYQVFVDFTKSFDTVNHDALWKVLAKLGCPCNFINMFKELKESLSELRGESSDEIAIDNGVKQGDIPTPTFVLYLLCCGSLICVS